MFVRGTTNSVYHRWFAGNVWSAWENLGGVARSSPAVVSRVPNTVDIAVGTDDSVWHRGYDGHTWSSWVDLGGTATSAPALASGGTRLDLFVRGTDNDLYHSWRPRTGCEARPSAS